MDIKSSYAFIHIGLGVRLLANLRQSKPSTAKKEIKSLRRNLDTARFVVSCAAIDSSAAFRALITKIEALRDDQNIPDDILKELRSRAAGLEKVIFAEACTKKLFTLPERRYDVQKLMTAPEKFLKEGAYQRMPLIAQSDFQSACRCLVFGEATASAFHMLRATEATLKEFYFHHRRTKRLEKPMWANMLDQLRAKKREKPSATLIASLDLIRQSYRNPTQHPEAIYTVDTAQDLFGLCIDVLGKMLVDLQPAL